MAVITGVVHQADFSTTAVLLLARTLPFPFNYHIDPYRKTFVKLNAIRGLAMRIYETVR